MTRGPLLALTCACLAGCGSGTTVSSSRPASSTAPLAATTATRSPATTSASTTTTAAAAAPDPGSLPQTQVFPSATSTRFHHEMTALWHGIAGGDPKLARTAFFPEGAYLQLKSIANARGDYERRLLYDYGLDIVAAHALVGSNARFLGVDVPSSYGHWVPPGVCDNGVGYYEVAHSRLLYRLHGVVRSLGIASMISWRGAWYVIHLGAILRSSVQGVVENPSAGRGVSPPSSTC